jgi:predicted Zn-dependent peptidase
MKLFLILFLFVSILFSKNISDPYKNIKYKVLQNGMKVYILSNKQATNTKLTIEVKMGTSIEKDDTAGITHLVEHLVFRDRKIPFNDYYDYLKDNEAINVNGYTSKYYTKYTATINSTKTKWLLKEFSKMLFKKNLNIEDLEIERNALQTEIGELKWYHKPLYLISKLKFLFPDKYNIYEDDFNLTKNKEKPNKYFYLKNNKKFNLDDIMNYYKQYYYPSNMILKIVGNFNDKEITNFIEQEYGYIKRTGIKTTKKPLYNSKLNNKVSHTYLIDPNNISEGYIGAKYIENSYKKYLILGAYTESLSKIIQHKLRNNLGQTYSVDYFNYGERDAYLTGISFDSTNKNFDENIEIVKKQILDDSEKITENKISKALKDYALYYSSLEPDTTTLYDLVDTQSYVHERYKIFDKTPYEIFKSISNLDFQKTVSHTFKKKNEYFFIYRDYYFFPFDTLVIYLIFILIILFLFIKLSKFQQKRLNLFYTQIDILFSRRISSRFFSILIITLAIFISIVIIEWIEHGFMYYIMNDKNFFNSIDSPNIFILEFFSFLLFCIICIIITITIFKYYFAKMDITEKRINLIGHILFTIEKDEIICITTVPWSFNKLLKTFGISFLFLRPLVKIETKKGKEYYIRSSNAGYLENDLKKWKDS